MRIDKQPKRPSTLPQQCALFEDDRYTCRIFCTNLAGKAHRIIVEYDKRADVENLVVEAKREGLDMLPSAKFKTNYAFFQIVMPAYNICRYMKMLAAKSISSASGKTGAMKGIVANTVRITRLKLLFIAAKVVKDANRDKVKYSVHDARTPQMLSFLAGLDKRRGEPKPWADPVRWPQRFALPQ